MNIAFFSECWDPQINGVVTSTKSLIGSLDPREDNVSIFAPSYPGYRDQYPYIFRQPAIKYFFQPEFYFSSPLPFAAIRQARKWKVEIVHLHTEFTLGMAAIRAARALEAPSVLTLHTLWEHYSHYFFWGILPRNLFRFFLSLIYQGPDYFIAPTNKAKDYLTGVMKIKKPVAVIPTGIKLDAFTRPDWSTRDREQQRSRWGVKPGDTLLMFAGRIGREKSIDVLLQGLYELKSEHPTVKLLLVGDGPYLDAVKRSAVPLGLAGKVIFTGYVPYDRMPGVYRSADVFTIASVSETQGLVTVEALASGLPVIAKNDPANAEILHGGDYGLVFGRNEEFGRTVKTLLTRPGLRQKLASVAPEGAKRYDAETYGQSVREYYHWIINDFRQKKVKRKAL